MSLEDFLNATVALIAAIVTFLASLVAFVYLLSHQSVVLGVKVPDYLAMVFIVLMAVSLIGGFVAAMIKASE